MDHLRSGAGAMTISGIEGTDRAAIERIASTYPPSPNRSIFQVFSFDIISKILLALLGFALIRYMSKTEYAAYTLATSITFVATQAIIAAFNRIYIVGFRRFDLSGARSPFLGLQILVILVMALAAYPFLGQVHPIYGALVLVVLALCLSEFTKTTFQQELKFIKFSMVEMSRTLLFLSSVAVLIILVHENIQVWQVLALQAGSLGLVFFVAYGRRLDRNLLRLGWAMRMVLSFFKGGYLLLFVYGLFQAVFSQVDVFMLNALADKTQVATYGSTLRYYTAMLMGLNAVHAVLLPSIQKATSTAELKRVFNRYRVVVATFSVGILLVDQGKYPAAVLTFRILAASTVVSTAFSPYTHLLLRFEDFKALVLTAIIALGLSLALNAFLIPSLQAPGAALATMASFGFFNVSIFLRGRQRKFLG
jgi:O-antigen/teichoic acid export membrane protein